MNPRRDRTELPALQDWLFSVGLYDGVLIDDDAARAFQRDMRLFTGKFDAYCVGCAQANTPIQGSPLPSASEEKKQADLSAIALSPIGQPVTRRAPRWSDRRFEVRFVCLRKGHVLSYFFGWTPSEKEGERGVIEKIGQTPSLADFGDAESSKYRELLGKEAFAEYRRGIGLFAHGIGIGSFVYLRRVFERLVEDSHAEAMRDEGWDEQAYRDGRMRERIALLAHHLPVALVEHADIYSILSKGLHELTEDECKRYFGTVKEGVDAILDDILAGKQKAQHAARLRKAIAEARGEIEGSNKK